MAQKRQQEYARDMAAHQGQLDMFHTAIKAAEEAGDWDKVASFTGLLGDFAQGGLGKKGAGKRDTALHAISAALQPVATQVSDYQPQDTTRLTEGSPEAVAATRPRKIADLPTRTVMQSSFEAAHQKQRREKTEDEQRREQFYLDKQAQQNEAMLDRQSARLEQQARIKAEHDNRVANLKATGKIDALTAEMAADPLNAGKSPDELRALAGEAIRGDRLARQQDAVDKHNKAKAALDNTASMISTRAGQLEIAARNAATNARNADTRARSEAWKEKAAGISAGMRPIMDGLNEANNRIGQLMTSRAYVALNTKQLPPEQVAAQLAEIDSQLGELYKQRDQYGVHLEGYKQQYEDLERQMGAPAAEPSTIPRSLDPMPTRPDDPRIGKTFTGKDGKRYKVSAIDRDGEPLVVPAQ